jgi:hypothetical protein
MLGNGGTILGNCGWLKSHAPPAISARESVNLRKALDAVHLSAMRADFGGGVYFEQERRDLFFREPSAAFIANSDRAFVFDDFHQAAAAGGI